MTDIISVIGAVIILGAYLGVQLKVVAAGKLPFSLLNLVGSAVLTYVAISASGFHPARGSLGSD